MNDELTPISPTPCVVVSGEDQVHRLPEPPVIATQHKWRWRPRPIWWSTRLPLRKNVCLLVHHSLGPQENKPISCHCDRIKMEPSYFSNTMQARREREGQWVREKEIQHHLPIKPMNYGAASFSRKDYNLILSPQDNYSKVQLLTSVSVWPCTTGSDTHPFYTFIFSLQHSKSAWWQWFIYRRLFLGSTAILLPRAAAGPRSHEPPWA